MTYIPDNPLKKLAVELDVNPWTVTSSGHKIHYAMLRRSDIRFRDIAWQLAHTNRWVGSLGAYYSTAQHSVLLARHALDCEARALPVLEAERTKFAKALLFHDSEEYLTCDFPAPLKIFFPVFTNYADFVRQIIFDVYNIPYSYYSYCKEWDRRILFDEAEWGLPGGRKSVEEPGNIVATLGVHITSWAPHEANESFRKMYLRLA